MKISQLLESTDEQLFNTIIHSEYFKKNIAPEIDSGQSPEEILNSGSILFHGTRGEMDTLYTQKYRTGTRDTVTFVHDTVNRYAVEKFGVPVRNLMFVTNNRKEAGAYGKVGMVMPVSDFTIYMNPNVTDFTVTYRSAHSMSELDENKSLYYHFSENIFVDYTRTDLYNEDDHVVDVLDHSIAKYVINVLEQGDELSLDGVRITLAPYKKASEMSDGKYEALCKFVFERFEHYKREYEQSLKDYVDGIERFDDGIVNKDWRWCEMMLESKRFALLSEKGLKYLVRHYLENHKD